MAKSKALIAISVLAATAVPHLSGAKPLNYQLPEETARLNPGPNVEDARNNCTGCHSPDYIRMQPQGLANKKDFWQAEVTKMIKFFGAPIDEADVPKIVEYLSQTY